MLGDEEFGCVLPFWSVFPKMFRQTTAVLVTLSAGFALELSSSRLLLCQDGAIATATSLDLLVIGRLESSSAKPAERVTSTAVV